MYEVQLLWKLNKADVMLPVLKENWFEMRKEKQTKRMRKASSDLMPGNGPMQTDDDDENFALVSDLLRNEEAQGAREEDKEEEREGRPNRPQRK